MMTLMMALVLLHCAALAGVLVMSQKSVLLVNEQGQPLARNNDWVVRAVPQAVPVTVETAHTPS